MVKCPFCYTTHVANTVFCSECGHYLIEGGVPDTDPLDTLEMEQVDDTDEFEADASLRPENRAAVIRLKIGEKDREVEITLSKPVRIGRVDPTSDTYPEIDVTDSGATAKSVSRRHAQILQRGSSVLVEDLGSVNGTYVNGKRLTPYLPQTLSNHDILYLGKLPVEIHFPGRA